jgi:nucleotide-binding universal stress UspA family protein
MRTEPVPAPSYFLADREGAIRVEMPRYGARTAFGCTVLGIFTAACVVAAFIWACIDPSSLAGAGLVGTVLSTVLVGCLFLGACGLVLASQAKEVVDVNGAAVTVCTVVRVAGAQLTLPRPQVYSAEHVRGLRVPSGALAGLAFDYGASTVHFARAMNEAEAKQVLRAILARFPGLGAGEGQN